MEEEGKGEGCRDRWTHGVVSKCITHVLGTRVADLIVVEAECGECLHEDRSGEMWKRERERDAEIVGLTVLYGNM